MMNPDQVLVSRKKPIIPPISKVDGSSIRELTVASDNEVDIFKNVFFPRLGNKPQPVPDIIRLNGEGVLGFQNSMSLIGLPGHGKTSTVEALASSYLNPDCDAMGLEVDQSCKGVIIGDTERTKHDVYRTYERIRRRAGIDPEKEIENVVIAGMRSIARVNQRKEVIIQLLENHPCSLLVLDGAGDFVDDTNDLAKAIEFTVWIRELTVKYNISILSTLHPNPGGTKPRGHHGSEMCRESESVFVLKSYDENTKLITCDFDNGKNRNNPQLTAAFRWSDQQKMFVAVEFDDLATNKKIAQLETKKNDTEKMAKQIFSGQTSLRNKDLVQAFMTATKQEVASANRFIKNAEGWGFIILGPDKYYRLNREGKQ